MDSYQEKLLLLEVAELKRIAAAQGRSITLLLGIVRMQDPKPHKANIVEAIESLPLGYSPEAQFAKDEAKKLVPLYFP